MSERFWHRWLIGVCALFCGVGVLVMLAWDTPLFAVYQARVAQRFWGGGATPHELRNLLALLYSTVGATIVGKWLLHGALVLWGVRLRQAWAYRATLFGLVTWFVIDSIASLRMGAAFNVWMINLAPFALMAPPLIALGNRCDADFVGEPGTQPPAYLRRWLRGAALLGVAFGVLVAFGLDSRVFAPWWDGLCAANFYGEVPPAAHDLVRFFAGPIGGSLAAMCLMLAAIAATPFALGARWAVWAGLAAVAGWFTCDALLSVAHDAAFNVLLLDVPLLFLLLPPLFIAMWRRPRAA